MKNPVVKGRMYQVSGGGAVRGVRFRKDGNVEVLVQPKAKSNRRKKQRPSANKKRKANKRVARKRSARTTRRKPNRKAPKKK
jgi:hypothetical protein